MAQFIEGSPLKIVLSQSSLSESDLLSDAFAIQRFLSVIRMASNAIIVWHDSAIDGVKSAPGHVPLLSSAIMLDDVIHELADGSMMNASKRTALRKQVQDHQFSPNWFDSADSIICADYISKGWHKDVYTSPGKLKDRNALEELINDLVGAKIEGLDDAGTLRTWRDSLAAVIYELFENTHIHGRFDYDKKTISKDLIRSIVVRRVKASSGGNTMKVRNQNTIDSLEISVIDSGIGFFGSRFSRHIAVEDDLLVEWQNVKSCLEVHVGASPISQSHRGIGLYEVLRALHFLKGSLQVRSGRVFGYRSFFPGDLTVQMESQSSRDRPGMPKVRLLDFQEPYRPTPNLNPIVRGVVVRTLVPLSWSK